MSSVPLHKVLQDSCGNEVHCKSQDALDHFNKGLLQYVRSYGNCMGSFEEALKLDNEFVLVNCVLGVLWLGGLEQPSDPLVATHIDAINKFSHDQLLPREKLHIDAFKAYASGDLPAACGHWAKCTLDHPRDALAIRNVFIGYLMLGRYPQMRDNLSSILTYWNRDDELYPFILSLYSFALEETGRFDEAASAAEQSLSINAQSPWATHALGHVIEEDRDVKEGVKFLTSTRNHWKGSGLGNHIAWHLCLYYIDLDDMDALLKEYDDNLVHKVSSDNMFGLLDASSLLWRLECLGVDVGDRWTKVQECFKPHLDNRSLVWYDTHLMMTLAQGTPADESTAKFALAEHLIKSLQDYAACGRSTDCKVAEMVGVPVCQALLAYGKQQYNEVVSLLVPLRYNFIQFGGSWAQRQVFSVTFIQAAIKSGQLKLALNLIAELKAVKPKNRRLPILFDQVKKMIES